MIYQVNKFESCNVTGFTDIDVSWNSGLGDETESKSFTSENDALHYIADSAKDALLFRLEKFTRSIQNLSNHDTGYYHSIAKDESLIWWLNTLPKLIRRDLPAICKNITHFKSRLYQILPGEKHPHYKALHNEAVEIAAFSKSNQEFKITNLLVPAQKAHEPA